MYKFISVDIKLQTTVLILASASKSRKNILKNSEIKFIQISSSFDESTIKERNVSNLVLELSFAKAKKVFEKVSFDYKEYQFKSASLEILGCDSVFEYNGKIFGKPTSIEEANERWLRMSGGFGCLHTGHTLLFCEFNRKENKIILNKTVKEVIISKIFFSELQTKEISKYVNTLEPLQCAGGFALEGRGGKFIEKIDGCFSNVMGLSLPWLRKTMLKEGIYA